MREDQESAPLAWTGERYVPELRGGIALEHVHRYALACELAAGRRVLDIACGEGYGSAMLAQVAAHVIGVDIARDVVAHAARRYRASNLEFKIGACAQLPLPSQSIDLVVSFETIEHHDQHDEMLAEIKRVLRPGGVLVISSPDKYEYSVVPNQTNPYHVKELYRHEFEELLGRYFAKWVMYGQRMVYGSAVVAESGPSAMRVYSRDGNEHRSAETLPRPQYLIAVASDEEPPRLASGLFEEPLAESEVIRWWMTAVADRDNQIRSLQEANAELGARAERAEAEAAQAAVLEVRLQEETARERELADKLALREAAVHAAEAEREAALARQRSLEAELDAAAVQVSELRASLAERDATMQRLEGRLRSEAQRGANLRAELSTVHDRVAELQQLLSAREAAAPELDEHLRVSHARAEELEAQVRLLQAEGNELRRALAERDEALRIVNTSKSWRLTAPLRDAAAAMRGLPTRARGAASTLVHRIDRRGNLRFAWRHRREGFWAALLGRRGWQSGSTQDTRTFRTITSPEDGSAQAEAVAESGEVGAAGSAVVAAPELWRADGITEWADYEAVRARIGSILERRLEAVRPAHVDTIDLDGADPSEMARRIALPPATAHPDVSIVIPVFDNLKCTIECLLSVSAHTGDAVTYEVIVADDASTDGTPRVLGNVPNLTVISNERNVGFLRNCNRAAAAARGRYLVLLNNDVQVTAGWLEAMLRTFEEEPNVGAVGPMIVFPNGRLQEAGARIRRDGSAEMIGLFDSPDQPRYRYRREVDYCSAACLLLETRAFLDVGGFDERYAPAYCEDSDLCLRLRARGKRILYCPDAVVVHHLSKTVGSLGDDFKAACVARNSQQLVETWHDRLDRDDDVRIIAFYLPQFHPIPENDLWWGKGFTEWTNVSNARPNFVGHYQPRIPADLGYYDLRVPEVLEEQARLAQRYGIYGFCFYYYWFAGKRLLQGPIERMLETGRPDIPFCLCWANENWTRRWDGRDSEILIAQQHSDEDDERVIRDMIRYFRSPRYIRIGGRPLVLVYRVTLFPDFKRTAGIWRRVCREQGVGEIYIALVESFELVKSGTDPARYGCDAAVEFPPHELAEARTPSGAILNPEFRGTACDYRDLAVRFATRPLAGYTRFRGVMPGWDNTARRQNDSWCFEHATPGAFQAWLEVVIAQTKQQCSADERLVFVNAWNEWAEGAYLEPDVRFGHTFLEAIRNAREASALVPAAGAWPGR